MARNLVILGTILLISANWSHAETLVQLRDRVDTFLTNKWPTLVARQDIYATNHAGRYWQGLISHTIIPTHLTAVPGDILADRLVLKPTDQAESWLDVLPEWNIEVFAAAAQVDIYDGPSGKGWVLTVFVRFNGVTYQRAKGFGADTSFDFAWRVFDPGVP